MGIWKDAGQNWTKVGLKVKETEKNCGNCIQSELD